MDCDFKLPDDWELFMQALVGCVGIKKTSEIYEFYLKLKECCENETNKT